MHLIDPEGQLETENYSIPNSEFASNIWLF